MRGTAERNELALRLGICYSLFYAIYGITSPYMPVILRGIGYSPSAIGALLATYELIGIGGPIFLARIADASGRSKPYFWASGVAIIAGLALLVTLRWPLFTILSLSLISLGLKTPIPILDASILRTIEAEGSRGRKMPRYGTFRAFGSVGFVLVTIGVQLLPGFDQSPPWVIAGSAGAMVLVYLLGVQSLPEPGSGKPALRKEGLNLSWVDRDFVTGLGVILLGRLSMASVNSFFSLYLVEELSWHVIGAMSALSALVEIPMMMLAWRFMKRRSPMAIIALASAAVVARLLTYALFPTKSGVIVGQLLHSLCYGLFQPAAVAFINLKTPPAYRTTGMALFLGFGIGIPLVVGSALGGIVVEALGYRWLFASFSVFALASLVLYATHRKALDSVR
jgi:MFS transporter, PPP family, 3-phenylpropionic acid transporter